MRDYNPGRAAGRRDARTDNLLNVFEWITLRRGFTVAPTHAIDRAIDRQLIPNEGEDTHGKDTTHRRHVRHARAAAVR